LEPVDVAALAERAQAGDGDAWEHLYRLAYPRLMAYARRRLADDAAVEAVSETMTRAVAAVDRFVWNGAGFEGWLFGILRHVVLDAQRAAGRRPAMTDADRTLMTRPSSEPGPLDQLVGDEEARAVRVAFERLGPADQELLELRVVAGLSAEDVGKALGKRPGAVRMAQNRALGRLRALMAEESP
jgi:RNA polymerase sigma-70 factor (ECF subfamily)